MREILLTPLKMCFKTFPLPREGQSALNVWELFEFLLGLDLIQRSTCAKHLPPWAVWRSLA